MYPWNFAFSVAYELDGSTVFITYCVENREHFVLSPYCHYKPNSFSSLS